jgi:hypothetical protein
VCPFFLSSSSSIHTAGRVVVQKTDVVVDPDIGFHIKNKSA